MHGRIVQRIGSPGDAQEARALLESLGAQAGHLLELFPAGEVTVGRAVVRDGLGKGRAYTAHILQQVRAGSVQGHAHAVHAAFHGVVQFFLQQALVYIVLILSYAQGLGVNLHQFGQGIHQAPADGNRATYGNVVLGKLLPAHLRGGIHGGAVLAHGEDADALRKSHLADEVLGLPSRGAAPDGNHLNVILFHQVGHLGDGLYFLGHGRMRENHIVGQQVPLRIQTNHLAAGAEARVDGHHPLLPHRRGQEQLAEVFSEYLDGFDIGLFLCFPNHLTGDGRVQQALPGIVHGLPYLHARLPAGIALRLAVIVIEFVAALLSVGVYLHLQEALVFCSQHGQQVMGRDFADGLAEVEVAAVFGSLRALLPGLGHLGLYAAGTVDGP